VIIVGGVHAREWVPPDAILYLCADLLEARRSTTGLTYGGARSSADDVARIFANLQLVLLPCANPDGRVFSQQVDPDWRKNRARIVAPNGDLCHGVDLNRNFDVAWDFQKHFAPGHVSASDDPHHKYLYVGPSAESEPETRNVVWLLDHYRGAGWFIDVHGAVPAVFHGWGIDENQVADSSMSFLNAAHDGQRGVAGDPAYREFMDSADLSEVVRLAGVMRDAVLAVNGDDYEVSPSFSLYATSGASDDYAFSRHRADSTKPKVLGFTIECGHDFQPDWPVAEVVMQEVGAAIVGFAANVWKF
jgi:murein tripeptide amidase MpaA